MPIIASPTFYNPQLGQAGTNMLAAIFGSPEDRMKRDYYDSEVTKNAALASKTNLEAARLRTGNAQFDTLPDIYQQMVRQPNETMTDWAARTAPLRGRQAQAYPGSNIAEAATANTAGLADIYAQGSNDDMARSLVMRGHIPGKDFAPTAERADAVSARDAAEALAQANSVANINAGSAANVANINLLKPDNVGAGGTGFVAPGSPLYPISDHGKLVGLPTKAVEQGKAGARLLGGEDSPILREVFDPGSVQRAEAAKLKAATPGKTPPITQAVSDGIEALALKGVQGATTVNPKTGKVVPVSDAVDTLDPAKRANALSKAGAVYLATKNQQAAADEYLKQMGIAPGSSYKEGWGWGSNRIDPPAAGAAAPPAVAVTAQPFAQTQAAIPPAAVTMLRNNPHLSADFDKKYGAGAASRALGGS